MIAEEVLASKSSKLVLTLVTTPFASFSIKRVYILGHRQMSGATQTPYFPHCELVHSASVQRSPDQPGAQPLEHSPVVLSQVAPSLQFPHGKVH